MNTNSFRYRGLSLILLLQIVTCAGAALAQTISTGDYGADGLGLPGTGPWQMCPVDAGEPEVGYVGIPSCQWTCSCSATVIVETECAGGSSAEDSSTFTCAAVTPVVTLGTLESNAPELCNDEEARNQDCAEIFKTACKVIEDAALQAVAECVSTDELNCSAAGGTPSFTVIENSTVFGALPMS